MRLRSRSAALAGAAVTGIALVLSGSGVALAGTTTSGAGSVLGGTQLLAPITIPINICGNAIAVLGVADASCRGGASAAPSSAGSASSSSGSGSVGGGNQISAPVTVPVNICGNSVAVLGVAQGSCTPPQRRCRCHHVPPPPPPPPHHHHHRPPHHRTHKTPPPRPQTHVAQRLPASGSLPITGVNLAGLGGGALGLIAAGILSMVGGRRRI
jgi:hypothetical protein